MSVPYARPQSSAALPAATPAVRAVLRLFAAARQAAGTDRAEVRATTVGDVLAWARGEYGSGFAAVLDRSRVWRNGEPAEPDSPLVDGDEVAVLPPVSGGSDDRPGARGTERPLL